MGISADTLSTLFEPFEQGDSSTSHRFGGTGLGLSICSRLAHLMHGSITVHSELGLGTEFCVRIEVTETPPRVATAKDELPCTFSGRILVAEDNTVNQIVIEALLRKRGLEVQLVANGLEAVEASGKKAFDLLLMDCHMPDLDGFGACQRIREREASAETSRTRTPVIALTADTSTDARARCKHAGMDALLSKPVDPRQLDSVLSL